MLIEAKCGFDVIRVMTSARCICLYISINGLGDLGLANGACFGWILLLGVKGEVGYFTWNIN